MTVGRKPAAGFSASALAASPREIADKRHCFLHPGENKRGTNCFGIQPGRSFVQCFPRGFKDSSNIFSTEMRAKKSANPPQDSGFVPQPCLLLYPLLPPQIFLCGKEEEGRDGFRHPHLRDWVPETPSSHPSSSNANLVRALGTVDSSVHIFLFFLSYAFFAK